MLLWSVQGLYRRGVSDDVHYGQSAYLHPITDELPPDFNPINAVVLFFSMYLYHVLSC